MSRSIRILGSMTGTSCDGIDLACLEIGAANWRTLWTQSESYPASLKKRVLKLQEPRHSVRLRDLLDLDRDLGLWYAKVMKGAISRHRLKRPLAIANHGQSVSDFPKRGSVGTSLQLGSPAIIARETGLTVVSNFRSGDMAAHGQGAPLAPIFHEMIASSLGLTQQGVAIHNIGGISNLTYIGRGRVMAFDTGPGNMWIDAATLLATKGKQSFDRGGLLAGHGAIDIAALKRILTLPYFSEAPPKSTGRDDFPFELLLRASHKRNVDLIATASAVTAWSIAAAYRRWILQKKLPLRNIFVCGGGAKNHYLLSLIQDNLPEVQVRPLEEVSSLSGEFIEAAAFSYLGYLSLLGKPVGGQWTGARDSHPRA